MKEDKAMEDLRKAISELVELHSDLDDQMSANYSEFVVLMLLVMFGRARHESTTEILERLHNESAKNLNQEGAQEFNLAIVKLLSVSRALDDELTKGCVDMAWVVRAVIERNKDDDVN